MEQNNLYRKWKREKVMIRGVKPFAKPYTGNEDGFLGKGLYTMALSARGLARSYGTVHFVVNGKPQNPKLIDSLNDFDFFYYGDLGFEPNGKTIETVEGRTQALGFDGIIIKGREAVCFKPVNPLFFDCEAKLKDYFEEVNQENHVDREYSVYSYGLELPYAVCRNNYVWYIYETLTGIIREMFHIDFSLNYDFAFSAAISKCADMNKVLPDIEAIDSTP